MLRYTTCPIFKLKSPATVMLAFLPYLIASKNYKEAADWCSKIKLSNKNWEEKILIFAKEGKLDDCYQSLFVSNFFKIFF